jgi:hypothetical protein
MKKILSLLFVFLLVIGSVYAIPRVKSASIEEEKAYYRSLIENPPADIESYEFTDYDIEMILEVKEDIRKEQYIKELKTEREKYISKETTNSNNRKQHISSDEELEMFEKLKQNNQQKLEQIDKVIMLLEESN